MNNLEIIATAFSLYSHPLSKCTVRQIKYQTPKGKWYLLVGSSLVVLNKFWMSLCVTYTQQDSLGWRHLTVIFFICFPWLYFTIVEWITKRLQDGQFGFLILSTTFTFKYIIVFYILKRTEKPK